MKNLTNQELNEFAKKLFREKREMETRQEIGKAKFRAFMLKRVESKKGESVEFPDIQESESAEVGDRVTVEDNTNATGTTTLKDGAIITYKDGFITEVDYLTNTGDAQSRLSITRPQRVKQCSKGNVVKIFGKDPEPVYKIGNEVTIDDKPRMIGVYKLGKTQISISNGKITSVKRVGTEPVTRQLFKKKKK